MRPPIAQEHHVATIAEQAARIESLEHQLAEMTAYPDDLPECLSPAQACVLGALYQARGRVLSVEQLLASYDSRHGRDGLQTRTTLRTMICEIRQRLAPHGVTIRTVWGRGYIIDRPKGARPRPETQEAAYA